MQAQGSRAATQWPDNSGIGTDLSAFPPYFEIQFQKMLHIVHARWYRFQRTNLGGWSCGQRTENAKFAFVGKNALLYGGNLVGVLAVPSAGRFRGTQRE